MKIEKLQPGMVVYSVERTKMGNTTVRTISIYSVKIEYVNIERNTVSASWNGNPPREYHSDAWSKWRLKKPMLTRSRMGYSRLATREEIAEAKAKCLPKQSPS